MNDKKDDLVIGVDPGAKDETVEVFRKDGDVISRVVDEFDEKRQLEVAKQLGIVGPITGKPPTAWQGPRRKPPTYYAGTHVGRHDILHPDTAVTIAINKKNPKKSKVIVGGIRNKAARRMIRGRLKQKNSNIEAGIHNAHMMHAQANEWGDSPGERKRIYDEALDRARIKKEDK